MKTYQFALLGGQTKAKRQCCFGQKYQHFLYSGWWKGKQHLIVRVFDGRQIQVHEFDTFECWSKRPADKRQHDREEAGRCWTALAHASQQIECWANRVLDLDICFRIKIKAHHATYHWRWEEKSKNSAKCGTIQRVECSLVVDKYAVYRSVKLYCTLSYPPQYP